MMQVVRAAMSLVCFAAAGGIVLAHKAADDSKGTERSFLAEQARLDALLEELTGDSAARTDGPVVLTNETIARMAEQQTADLNAVFPALASADVSDAPSRRGFGARPAPRQPKSRAAYPSAGSRGRPVTIWERSRWRDDMKIKDRDRDRRRKQLGARSRIAQYRGSTVQRLYGTSDRKSHFERSRRYRQYGSVWSGLGRTMNPALRRGRRR